MIIDHKIQEKILAAIELRALMLDDNIVQDMLQRPVTTELEKLDHMLLDTLISKVKPLCKEKLDLLKKGA